MSGQSRKIAVDVRRKTNHVRLMRFFRLCHVWFFLGTAAFALAAPQCVYAQTIVAKQKDAKKLDDLFVRLKSAKSEAIAKEISKTLRSELMDSGSANVDLLVQWAQEAMKAKDNYAALDFLDQVVTLKPDFAEGWNQRASLHFKMNNYTKAMVDIEKTLNLEPRHFDALTGMGTIFIHLKRNEKALSAYQKALEIYPLLREVQKAVGEIEDQMAGSRI